MCQHADIIYKLNVKLPQLSSEFILLTVSHSRFPLLPPLISAHEFAKTSVIAVFYSLFYRDVEMNKMKIHQQDA